MDNSLFGYSIDDFKEEAGELLAKAESILVIMGDAPGDTENLNALFRAVHSLKGSAAYAGLDNVNTFSHLYESLLGDIRNNKLDLSTNVYTLLVRARDFLEDLILHPDSTTLPEIDESSGDSIERLSLALGAIPAGPGGAECAARPGSEESGVIAEGESVKTTVAPPPAGDVQKRVVLTTTNPFEMDQDDVIKVTLTKGLKAFAACLKKTTPDFDMLAKVLKKLEETLSWAFADDAGAALKELESMRAQLSAGQGDEQISGMRRGFKTLASAIKMQLSSMDISGDGAGGKAVDEEGGSAVVAPLRSESEEIAGGKSRAIAEKKEAQRGSAESIRGASEDDIVKITVSKALDSISVLLQEERPEMKQMGRMIKRLSDINSWAFHEDESTSDLLGAMKELLRRPYDEAVRQEMKLKASALSSLFTSLMGEGDLEGSHEQSAEKNPTKPANIENPLVDRRAASLSGPSLRVRSADLETLMDTVGQVEGIARKDLERLQSQTLQLRMVPVGELFGRFRKVVRDISVELGKEIELDIEGESVKLDKFIADKLQEPILHMVRNAAGHGLEDSEERAKAGKGAGIIKLKAYQEGGQMIIEVSDNGKGISLEKVRKTAVAKGLVKGSGEELSNKNILDLIFKPGFSTRESADSISGRGVGMDVVREMVSSVQGAVTLETKEGRGTTFRLILPLTLAIVNALILDDGGSKIAISGASVDRIVNMSQSEIRANSFVDKDRLSLDLKEEGDVLPIVNLSAQFGRADKEGRRCVVLVRSGPGQRVALVVDSAVGRRSLAVKPMDRFASNKFFSSASVVDEELVLVLNVPSLIAA
ncbi:MAG: ATP-binding protein [bacterium]|nr:ATP-binding protein [bacterium]